MAHHWGGVMDLAQATAEEERENKYSHERREYIYRGKKKWLCWSWDRYNQSCIQEISNEESYELKRPSFMVFHRDTRFRYWIIARAVLHEDKPLVSVHEISELFHILQENSEAPNKAISWRTIENKRIDK